MLLLNSWGNYPKLPHAAILTINWRDEKLPSAGANESLLAHGQGKSYGDSCLNENGTIILTKRLNHFIHFDTDKGILECEAGVTLSEILELIVPHGWFLPVLPGTQFVSVGGAIANDVHGKNHHVYGTFGKHVLSFELIRSNGEKLICSPSENVEHYQATIGGLGLTGLILSARLQLKPISSGQIETEHIPFHRLEDFFEISKQSEKHFEYTVAWLDCISKGSKFGRGIFMRANHAKMNSIDKATKKKALTVPFHFPTLALNPLTMKIFNEVYYRFQAKKKGTCIVPYQPFFFPLDSLLHWNRIYGKKGFLQYQCVLPKQHAQAIIDILKVIVNTGQASFLSVLKMFGNVSSPGMLSFPKEGVTLALDLPFRGEGTLKLLNQLDQEVMALQGKVYPAKDARMSSEAFKAFFPNWQAFLKYKDPQFSSSFWRRVMNDET